MVTSSRRGHNLSLPRHSLSKNRILLTKHEFTWTLHLPLWILVGHKRYFDITCGNCTRPTKLQPGAHNPERATPMYSCHGVFTDRLAHNPASTIVSFPGAHYQERISVISFSHPVLCVLSRFIFKTVKLNF